MNWLFGVFVLLKWFDLYSCQDIVFPDEFTDGKYNQMAKPSTIINPNVQNAVWDIFGTPPGNSIEESTALPTVLPNRRPFPTTPSNPEGIRPTKPIETTTKRFKPFPNVPSKTTRKPTISPDYDEIDEEFPVTTPKRTTPKRRPTPPRTRKPFTTTESAWNPDVQPPTTKRKKLSDIAFDTIEGIFGLGSRKTTRKPSYTGPQNKPTEKPNVDNDSESSGPGNWHLSENIYQNSPNKPQYDGHENLNPDYSSQQHLPAVDNSDYWQNPANRPNSDNSHHHNQWPINQPSGNDFNNQRPQINHQDQTHPHPNNNFGNWQRPSHSGSNFGDHNPFGHNQANGAPTRKPNNLDSYYVLGPFELMNTPSTLNAECINGYLRDAYNCSIYYKCLPNGERLKFTCGANMYFDIITLTCYPIIYGIC